MAVKKLYWNKRQNIRFEIWEKDRIKFYNEITDTIRIFIGTRKQLEDSPYFDKNELILEY